ncbi:MAG: hypothetical protein PHW82_11325 [Bacteroidales bacterium]|nr:hypothetical protein [Bacteroidales bacterium]
MKLNKHIILAVSISLLLTAVGCNSNHPKNDNNETENIEPIFTKDSSNLDFLNSDMSYQEVENYEKSLSSAIVSIDGDKGYSTTDVSIYLELIISSGELAFNTEIEVNEEIYPYNKEIILTSASLYMRKYKSDLRLKTSYFFNNENLALQIHEWGNFGIDSLNVLNRTNFENIFLQIQEKITKIKGVPDDSLSNNNTSFDIIWDNSKENIRLKLNDLDTTYNIKLYQYKKTNTSH